MSTATESGPAETVDVRGVVLAITAVLAATATFLVTPGSGAGPAAVAVLTWLTALSAASWAACVDEDSSVRGRIGAGVCMATLGAGFVAAIESAWALAFPAVALAGALSRRRSLARFVALAAWLTTIVYILAGPGLD